MLYNLFKQYRLTKQPKMRCYGIQPTGKYSIHGDGPHGYVT